MALSDKDCFELGYSNSAKICGIDRGVNVFSKKCKEFMKNVILR